MQTVSTSTEPVTYKVHRLPTGTIERTCAPREHRRLQVRRRLVAMEATAGELILLGMCGAAFGSFVNVLAYRLPRRESIVKPRSRCPGCGTTIRSRDNIPVVSWLLLRGRCRDCGIAIPLRYPLVEVVTAGLFVLLGFKFGREAALWPALALAVILVAAAAAPTSRSGSSRTG